MTVSEYLKEHILYLDGGMGTLLQEAGLPVGELPERWNLSHPEAVKNIHLAYLKAGSRVISTNTFGANRLKMSSEELDAVIGAAVRNAREAVRMAETEGPHFVALDIGPTGRMLRPYGDLDFEQAVSVFAETVCLGVKYGVDLIFIETMNDSYETKAALLAAKENASLPVFVSNAYGEDGKLMTGATPAAMVALLEGMGADAVGVNCSLGPAALRPVVEEYLKNATVPVLIKPNAGLPAVQNGKTVYSLSPSDFAEEVADMLRLGARAAGGCCGTTPEYIRMLTERTAHASPVSCSAHKRPSVSSYTHALFFDEAPVLIGERINPTGKKLLKEALRTGDMDYILREGLAEETCGVHALDVNVGLPEIDECAMLSSAIAALQAVTDLPLQIDTADPTAMEKALRIYNGKALINSVNGKKESLDAVLPLAKKYGGLVVALTLDENGIPPTAEGRLAIAEKILSEARKYGLGRSDFMFDPLALTVSADSTAPKETLRAVRLIRERLGCAVSLGVSNVSFGLPARDAVNGAFFAMALSAGLSAAIMNPYSAEMMKTYHASRALLGYDENCARFIGYAETALVGAPGVTAVPPPPQGQGSNGEGEKESSLAYAIIKGLARPAAELTESLLVAHDPMDIVTKEIIPALDKVGEGYEKKEVYLPALLMSAEAAKASFEVIRASVGERAAADRPHVVIATVKGDIHDIGKNIVKLLLENYGFPVTDLGKDVPPESVLEATLRLHAPLVGLSALMTTTTPAMEETVRLLKKEAPFAHVVVGGAVLTAEYAAAIGADRYARDAMETVRYAEEVERLLSH